VLHGGQYTVREARRHEEGRYNQGGMWVPSHFGLTPFLTKGEQKEGELDNVLGFW